MRKNWLVEIVLDGIEDGPGDRPQTFFEFYRHALAYAQECVDEGNEVVIAIGPGNAVMTRDTFKAFHVKPGQDVVQQSQIANP